MRAHAVASVASALMILIGAGCREPSERSAAERLTAPDAGIAENFSTWTAPVGLGTGINTPSGDQQPALSKDGLSLYFMSNRLEGAGDATADNNLWVSRRACLECPWEAPASLASLNTASNENSPNLSRDEHWLYFSTNRLGNNDIWVAYRANVHDDLAWQDAAPLGSGVNTVFNENGASYFENDGGAPQLFFTRQLAPGSTPAGDLYFSELLPDGSWSVAVPIEVLNSADADQRPSIAHTGLEIYYWSGRPIVEGGASGPGYLWRSTRASVKGEWAAPQLVESPVADRSAIQPFIHSHGRTETLLYVHNNGVAPAMNLDIVASTRTRGRSR